MIYGVGTDICSIERMQQTLSKQEERFINRLLTETEQINAPKPFCANFIAKRWAAKEAVSKALGVGIGENLSFHDIEVIKSESGQPVVVLSHKAQQLFKGIKLHISLSDEHHYAIAYAIAEKI